MARNRKGDPVHGWVNLYKPLSLGSTPAVAKLRRILNAQKIGHAGTLDPLASGVLPIALGDATKTIQFMQDADKTYKFSITWGEQRDTDDLEGKVIATSEIRPPAEQISHALHAFIGEISQIPPLYSAIKVNGERAYDLARAGEFPELKPRQIHVDSLELLDARNHEADFIMTCGKGTYVRSIARDLALALGTVGYVSKLHRSRVGIFTDKNAISLDILENMDYQSARNEALLPLQRVLDDIPALAITVDETAKIRNGQVLSFVSRPNFERLSKIGLNAKEMSVVLLTYQNEPVALAEVEKANIKPVRVFNI